MKYILKSSIVVFLTFIVIGCGEDASSGTSSLSKIEVQEKNAKLNESKLNMTVDFILKNTYSSNINVLVENFDLDIASCIVDSVVFSPTSIVFEEEKEKIVKVVVNFAEACSPTTYKLTGISSLTLDGKTNTKNLDSQVKEISVEENQIILGETVVFDKNITVETNSTLETNTTDTVNYGIRFSLEAEELMKFNLEEKKSIQIALIDKDINSLISDKNIVNLSVTSKQKNLLKLFDASIHTSPSAEVSYQKINNLTVYAQTYKRSGLADIDVEIEYINIEGTVEKIKKTYSTLILSGPPTAFSINDDGVSYNFETKWFEHKYLISAVDKYNNHVNISPTIYVNAMTDFIKDSSGKPVLYGKFGAIKGSLIADENTKSAYLEVNSSIFDKIDYNRDYALVFGDIYSYEALGKWDINQDLSSGTVLYFSDTYNGEDYNKLGFAVGHNYMEEVCDSSYREWHLKIDSTDGSYTLDEEGETTVTVKYPAQYLYGKLGAISVNFLGKNPKTDKILKSGEVYFDVWNNVEGLKGETYKIIKGSGTLKYRHTGVINTGTGDEFSLKNSHFSCTVEVTNGTINTVSRNTIITNASECGVLGEYSYIEYEITASGDNDGTVIFSDCYVNGVPRF